MSRVVLCVDMDAFFASVEQKTNPRLRGKPIGVIGSAKRTVITTASYEARKFGVKTGMSVREARQACPAIILVVGNNEKYTDTCRQLQGFYLQFTPDIEIYSIDGPALDRLERVPLRGLLGLLLVLAPSLAQRTAAHHHLDH